MTNDEKFLFRRSFYDSLQSLDEKDRLRFYEYIYQYAFERIEPKLEGIEKSVWISFKSKIDEDREKYEYIRQIRSEAGKKGGAPKGNNNAAKNKQDNQNNHLVESIAEPSQDIANATENKQMVDDNNENKQNNQKVEKTTNSLNKQAKTSKTSYNNINNNITRNINITRNNNNNDDDEEKKNCCCSSSSFNLEFFRVDIKSFVNEWDMVYDGVNSAKYKTPMQKIDELDAALPVDAQDRLDRLVCEIVQYIKTEDVDILYQKLCGKNFPEGYELTDKVVKALCNRIIERAMLKLAWAKIKPKTSIFGSFVWFMKFDNVKKLINGEIV